MSYIKLSTTHVLELCSETIERLHRLREEEKERYLENRLNVENNRFFHKLFKMENISKDRLKELLDTSQPHEEIYWKITLPAMFSDTMRIVMRVGCAAMESSGDMWLSTEDYWHIGAARDNKKFGTESVANLNPSPNGRLN